MRACVVALLAALFVVGCFADFGTNITAQSANGFDVIVLDTPSWATHLQISWGQHEFFVFGERTLRTIATGPNVTDFYATPVTGSWEYPLIDMHTTFYTNPINNATVKLTMGTADFDVFNSNNYNVAVGPYVPLFSVNEDPTAGHIVPSIQRTVTNITSKNIVVDLTGYLSYAVRIDPRNASNGDIVAYFAGYVIDGVNINFALTRTHYNPSGALNAANRVYIFDPAVDVFTLYTNSFTAYSSTYKPFIHFFPNFGPLNHTFVIVIDPNTMTIYGVDVDAVNPTVQKYPLPGGYSDNDIVSATLDFMNKILYVGISTSGFAPGVIGTFNFANAPAYTIPNMVPTNLPANYSNPKALAADGTNLYIGMNGYNEILRFNPNSNSVDGYQRLPEYLHRSWEAIATIHHVYFVTYEQNSKVFRVDKKDFCPAACPYNGYCKGGQCLCSASYVMNNHKTECVLQVSQQIIAIKHEYTTVHDGEIVLGVFFALAVIAAAVGWLQWYRVRRGSYQAV